MLMLTLAGGIVDNDITGYGVLHADKSSDLQGGRQTNLPTSQ